MKKQIMLVLVMSIAFLLTACTREEQKIVLTDEQPANTIETEGPTEKTENEREIFYYFNTYRTAFEIYMRETAGRDLHAEGLNAYLDASMQVSGENQLDLTAVEPNPLGVPYKVEINQASQKLVLRTVGENEKSYIFATYYQDGRIDACMDGFDEERNMQLSIQSIETCGADLQK